jgi:hypothetical protein
VTRKCKQTQKAGEQADVLEQCVLPTHLFLLEALQPLLSLPEPTQSKWVMAKGGWKAREVPAWGFEGAVSLC